jgi:hypothetical protein
LLYCKLKITIQQMAEDPLPKAKTDLEMLYDSPHSDDELTD